jgi:L-ascorbate metabolism protein UlaG (beta-lactamase superfamily)
MPTLTHVDTACAFLEVAGWRLLTDPVLDAPGRRYHFGFGALSRKTGWPALSAAAIGAVDAVLLSHHQHGDNLDVAGAAFARAAPLVLTTLAASRTLPGGRGLAPWQEHALVAAGRPDLRITATPARHRPGWLPELLSGPVIGFVLESAGLPRGALWVSGDTVLFEGVREVARRFRVDTLVVHVGAVRFPWLSGPARYTFDAREAVEVARLTGARLVVPIHTSGWTHFREGPEALQRAFLAAGLAERLRFPSPGRALELGDQSTSSEPDTQAAAPKPPT